MQSVNLSKFQLCHLPHQLASFHVDNKVEVRKNSNDCLEFSVLTCSLAYLCCCQFKLNKRMKCKKNRWNCPHSVVNMIQYTYFVLLPPLPTQPWWKILPYNVSCSMRGSRARNSRRPPVNVDISCFQKQTFSFLQMRCLFLNKKIFKADR